MNRQYAIYMGLCLELVGLVLVLIFIGKEIDTRYNSKGFGIIGGAVLAMVIWIYHLMVFLKKEDKQ